MYIGSDEDQSCLPKDNEERSMSMWMNPTSYNGKLHAGVKSVFLKVYELKSAWD